MKKKMIPLIVLGLLIVALTLYFEFFRHGGDSGKISGSGTIEVTEVLISTKISGRVVELPKPEGADVNIGDLVCRLEYDELSAQRLSIKANLANHEKNFARARELYKTGSISQKDYDAAQAAYSIAKGEHDNINAQIVNAVIYAPIAGTILDTHLEVGEIAFPGTAILTIGDLTKPWMYIYVKETELGLVKIGQSAKVFIDSYSGKAFQGKVVSISNKAEFTPKTIETKDERVKLVFAVKVMIENIDMILKPGMPADAEIITIEKAE